MKLFEYKATINGKRCPKCPGHFMQGDLKHARDDSRGLVIDGLSHRAALTVRCRHCKQDFKYSDVVPSRAEWSAKRAGGRS